MRLFAGTSGFSYPEWRGTFYPEGLKEAGMLRAYSERLPTVEINNTFYQMPKPNVLEKWASTTPEAFSFALKAPRRITHMGKLKRTAESLQSFFAAARALGEKLGPILFQLPPTFQKDVSILSDFLQELPEAARIAFEFRHPSWFTEDVYCVLADRGVALTAAEVDADEGTGGPFVRTAPFAYVRLRRTDYDDRALAAAMGRVAALGVDEAFVYFKHEVLGPSYALELLARTRSLG